jgi:Protein of unknown function (DUF4058)
MPMNDWTRVSAGTYHFFHQRWIMSIADSLNFGGLPKGYYAMAERRSSGLEPDVLTLELPKSNGSFDDATGGVAVATHRPKTRFVVESEQANHARRADRLAIYDVDSYLVAIIEIVSPGNKDRPKSLDDFVKKVVQFLDSNVHVLVVDPFPPTRRDPDGIHKAIWDAIEDEPFALPEDKQLTCVSYSASGPTAYIEPYAVGDPVPEMPLFLGGIQHVPCPLETTYQATWAVMPEPVKNAVLKVG